MIGCESTYRDEDGTLYECAGISCPLVPGHHKAWAVNVTWTDDEAFAASERERIPVTNEQETP